MNQHSRHSPADDNNDVGGQAASESPRKEAKHVPRSGRDDFIGLTSKKALGILLSFASILAVGFLFLVVHVWDGITDDIKSLRSQSHADLHEIEGKLNTSSVVQGKLDQFFQNEYPRIATQLAKNTDTQIKLEANLTALTAAVDDLKQSVAALRDSIIPRKKSDFYVIEPQKHALPIGEMVFDREPGRKIPLLLEMQPGGQLAITTGPSSRKKIIVNGKAYCPGALMANGYCGSRFKYVE